MKCSVVLVAAVGLALGACQMSPAQRAQANAEALWLSSVYVNQDDAGHEVSCWVAVEQSNDTTWWVLTARQVVDGGGCVPAVLGFTAQSCQVLDLAEPFDDVIRCTGSV